MASSYTTRLIVVIPATLQAAANTRLQAEPEAGSDATARSRTFDVPLSPTGLLPATHYWCNWQMKPETDAMLRAWRSGLPAAQWSGVRIFDAATTTPDDVLATLGLQRIRRVG